MPSLSRIIKEFKKESIYNKVRINDAFDNYNMDREINEVIFIIDKEIEELNRLNEIYKLNHTVIYNGLAYKIKSIEYNIPTYNDPITWLKINIY